MIHISQAAAKEIKRLKQVRQQSDNLFRLTVNSGGCSGLFYNLEFAQVGTQTDSPEEAGADYPQGTLRDRVYECNGLTVVIDAQTYSQVQGLKLDYSEDLMGGGFRFQNPNATSTCSCGLSFALAE